MRSDETNRVWRRPFFSASGGRAWLDLVIFVREKPALGVDLGEEDGFPAGYEIPPSIAVRTTSLAEHRADFASYLEGPFRELAGEQIGEAADALDDAAWAISIAGSIADPPDLAHVQAVRAFERYVARNVGAIAIANDLSLSWQDAALIGASDPAMRLRIEEWTEVLYDPDVKGLHTRGMEQFARPDIAIFDLPEHRLERASQLLRHVAFLEAHGTLYAPPASIEVDGTETSPSSTERVTVALARLDAPRCKALAVRTDTLVIEGWPAGGIA